MRTSTELKKEWLRFSGLDYSVEDRWVRDRIAELFDVKQPNERQRKLLSMVDTGLTLQDLPAAAWPTHKQELMALALAEFGPPPSLFSRIADRLEAAGAAVVFLISITTAITTDTSAFPIAVGCIFALIAYRRYVRSARP